MVGHPLEAGTVDSLTPQDRLTVQDLDRLLKNPDHQGDWLPRLKVALAFAKQTNAMGIVLEALAVRLESQLWRDSVLRRTGWYLLLLVVTMVFGLALFFHFSNPWFESLRSDLQLMSVASYVPPTDPAASIFPTLVGALVLGLIALVFVLMGGPSSVVGWLGGRSILRWRQMSVALAAIENLNQEGMPIADAIEFSCDLVAAGQQTRNKIKSALAESKESSGIAAWADTMADSALDRMTKIELWLPLATTTIIGGTMATIYCLLIYEPIISILYELTSAAEAF